MLSFQQIEKLFYPGLHFLYHDCKGNTPEEKIAIKIKKENPAFVPKAIVKILLGLNSPAIILGTTSCTKGLLIPVGAEQTMLAFAGMIKTAPMTMGIQKNMGFIFCFEIKITASNSSINNIPNRSLGPQVQPPHHAKQQAIKR